MFKKCTICLNSFPRNLGSFHKNVGSADNLKAECKSCVKIMANKRIKAKKEREIKETLPFISSTQKRYSPYSREAESMKKEFFKTEAMKELLKNSFYCGGCSDLLKEINFLCVYNKRKGINEATPYCKPCEREINKALKFDLDAKR